jgi:hypothetical protein
MVIPNSIKQKLADPMTGLGYDFVHSVDNQVIHTGKIRINDDGEIVFNDVAFPDGIRLTEIVRFREHINESFGSDLASKHLSFKDDENENAISLIDIRNRHLNDESYEYWWSINRKYDFVKDANVHVLSGGESLVSTLDQNFDPQAQEEGTLKSGWSVKEFFNRQYAFAKKKNAKFNYCNFWFDVPGVFVVTPPYLTGKSCIIEAAIPLKFRGKGKKFIALRLFDATACVELARTHWSTEEYENDVYMSYRGELPDTLLNVPTSNDCECVFDLTSQQSFDFDLPSVKKTIPQDQHIILLQFSIIDDAEHVKQEDGTIDKIVNAPDFYFGGGKNASIDFIGFQKFEDEYIFQQNVTYIVDGDDISTASIDIDRVDSDSYTLSFSSNKNIEVWVESQTIDNFIIKWSPSLPTAVIDWQLNAIENQNNKPRYSTNHWKFREEFFNICNIESRLEFVQNNVLCGRIVGIDFLEITPTVIATAVAKENGPSPTTPIVKSAFPELDGTWKIEGVDDRFDYLITLKDIPTETPVPPPVIPLPVTTTIPPSGGLSMSSVIIDPTQNATLNVTGTFNIPSFSTFTIGGSGVSMSSLVTDPNTNSSINVIGQINI